MFQTLRQNSAYRSVRYSTIRKDSYTADNSQRLSQIRVKRKPIEQSTFYNTRTIELKPRTAAMFANPETSTYMESFTSMFHSEKNVKEKDNAFKSLGLKIKFTNFDDDFLKEDGTQFTLLDPFHRPYTYLTSELSKQEKQLQSQKEDLRALRAQLNIMRRNALFSLKQSEESGNQGIDRLRQMLKKNQIECQETRMRVRREITELYMQHDGNVQLKEELIDRSRGMQRDIFSCEPFELQVEAE